MTPIPTSCMDATFIHRESHCICGYGLILDVADLPPGRREVERWLARFERGHRGPAHRLFESRAEAAAAREEIR